MASKKGGHSDLWALAGRLGIRTSGPAGRARRSIPRGRLKPAFWNAQFERAAAHLEGWGYDVVLEPGAVDHVELGGSRTITVNSSTHPETRLYTLLHEAGHIIIRRQWKRFSQAHPRYLSHPEVTVDPRHERSKAYRVGLIHEELEAWAQGLKLAQRLGLFVDPVKFDSDKNEAILSYIEWVSSVSQVQSQAARVAARTKADRSGSRQPARRGAPRNPGGGRNK